MSLVQRQRIGATAVQCTCSAETVEQQVDGSWQNEDAVVQHFERPV